MHKGRQTPELMLLTGVAAVNFETDIMPVAMISFLPQNYSQTFKEVGNVLLPNCDEIKAKGSNDVKAT